jgi:hypothetical protein
MSRTDKDVPWWVATEWYEPDHNGCQSAPSHVVRWTASPRESRVCDLPEVPTRHNPYMRAWRGRKREMHCVWEAQWPWKARYRYGWGPTREDCRLVWWGPDRRRIRDECRKAVQEYRGTGDVEIVVSTRHHTHSPAKGWWD